MTVRFLGVDIETGPDVLVPRAETELLGRTALELLEDRRDDAVVAIDLCCGAGNLACAIAHARPAWRIWASDLTDPCVALARQNAARLGVAVEVVQGDLFAALEPLRGGVDLVTCNPPYISTGRLAKDRAHLLESEPRAAFDGGPYGLAIHQRAIKAALGFLRPGGWLVFEMGEGQERQLFHLFARAGEYGAVRSYADAQGVARVIAGRREATTDGH